MLPRNAGKVGLIVLCCLLASSVFAQETKIPAIKLQRAEESYAFLDSAADKTVFLQPLKYIPINRNRSVYLSLGGEYRARLEHFTNENYTPEDRTYFSQRLDFHASLQLGANLRLFGELYSGFVSGPEKIFLESDDIDLHQGFLEWKSAGTSKVQVKVRLGRQEIGYGASRLVGFREGPNMRRSFDMARAVIRKRRSSIDLFYGKEVATSFGGFDNRSNVFNRDAANPSFWGVFYRRPILKDIGKLDVYYFGFHSNLSRFNDVAGEETRHSVGLRSYSVKGRLSYNTELILQAGEIGGSSIFAYNLETDWKYTLVRKGWKPKLGIKADWSSGDRNTGDGRVGTFNPIFVNPAIYSLAAVNTPANIMSLHPNLTLFPKEGLVIYVDYAFFYRTQVNDGLYGPPRFLVRAANGLRSKHIGDVIGLQLSYEIHRNVSFDLRTAYFFAGRFIEASGDSENTFYIAPTVGFKF